MKRYIGVLLVAALAVLAALVGDEYPRTGFWMVCGITGLYILTELPGAWKRAVAFRRISAQARLKLLSTVLMVAILVGALVRGGRFTYIPMFLLLAYDFYYYEKHRR